MIKKKDQGSSGRLQKRFRLEKEAPSAHTQGPRKGDQSVSEEGLPKMQITHVQTHFLKDLANCHFRALSRPESSRGVSFSRIELSA